MALISNLSFCVLLGSIYQEVANTPRVAPFVVIPCNQLDERLVQHDAARYVEDTASGVTDKVGGDHCVFSVIDDTLELFGLGSGFHSIFDLLVGGRLGETNNQVDNRNIEGGNTEGKTTRVKCSK